MKWLMAKQKQDYPFSVFSMKKKILIQIVLTVIAIILVGVITNQWVLALLVFSFQGIAITIFNKNE